MLIDSHAHINYDRNMDTNHIIENMQNDSLYAIVNIGTNVEDSNDSLIIAKSNKNIYTTVGIHPEYADSVSDQDLKTIKELALEDKVVAIGEIGLDYHYSGYNKQKQIEVFTKQIELAISLDLPICVHTRDAIEDTYNIIKMYSEKLKRKGVIHCFSETSIWAEKFTKLGFYISFAGNVTFKKYDRSVLDNLSIDKILVETDCPFLSPEPFRGRQNEPKMVFYTARMIANTIGVDFEDFCKKTLENTKKLYFKIK